MRGPFSCTQCLHLHKILFPGTKCFKNQLLFISYNARSTALRRHLLTLDVHGIGPAYSGYSNTWDKLYPPSHPIWQAGARASAIMRRCPQRPLEHDADHKSGCAQTCVSPIITRLASSRQAAPLRAACRTSRSRLEACSTTSRHGRSSSSRSRGPWRCRRTWRRSSATSLDAQDRRRGG